jgi:tryptophan synthase beta chain
VKPVKYLLPDTHIPHAWYNLRADFTTPMPSMVHPGTGKPVTPDMLEPLFGHELIKQEFSTDRWIEIPEEVRQILAQWRCTPLYRARQLEKALDTPAKIFYKYEGVSPSGSHKTNSAIPQAYFNKLQGVKKITTETGAGQWGSALSMACCHFGLECKVYMVKVSYNQKPYRRALMETFGASVIASPSDTTNAGRAILAKDPDCTGSLGMAISEAVEIAAMNDDTRYCLGSVLNHVCIHQSVIGQECITQMELADAYPDIVIGCCGGGSNFAGIAFPFIGRMLQGKEKVRAIGVEPAACPSLTKGKDAYDFGDTGHMTPLMQMYTLGSTFVPPGLHAGGLRYHGMAPMVSHAMRLGLMEAQSFHQLDTFAAGVQFAKAEGILPAPESTHAVACAIKEALRCKKEGKVQTILFNLSGHGHFDMQAYIDYHAGKLQNYAYPKEEIAMALAGLPAIKE